MFFSTEAKTNFINLKDQLIFDPEGEDELVAYLQVEEQAGNLKILNKSVPQRK
ncbi:hypothetical protein SUFG_00054 [Sulfitobacter phage phiCB2047-B]|uniref:Uncharacterized protein n=1 Tax=Sulfitobacter phage phiCB2047-B TaxID=754046 RepID=M4PRP5_9CAUD|nr:hypothetical protein SUFG_00054 [Sulfitobacter phage phiCB2047-B]AGH07421.1 hypothetical protein SUFG_00054 [Sulfitobacter phage phiCB2047-B]